MARVVLFTTNKPALVLDSVNTPEYEGRVDCVINPDLSAVQAVNRLYWKKSGNSVVEMTQAEKVAVDSVVATEKETVTQNFEDLSVLELAKALVLLENQKKPTTKVNLIAAIKAIRS